MDQSAIDERIQQYYSREFVEAERLAGRSAQGRLELERVQELLTARLPTGSRILDVGGGAGVHAGWLARAAHRVTLLDPVAALVEQARRIDGVTALVGDARTLPFRADEFDAVIMFGPLYHLASRDDRVTSIREAARVCRSDGWVFTTVISRFIRHAAMSLCGYTPQPAALTGLLERGEPDFEFGRFPGAHFHTGDELAAELADAALAEIEVCGIEGPDGLAMELVPVADDELHRAAITTARAFADRPDTRELSCHLMGIARVR